VAQNIRARRSNRWFVLLFILMVVGGVCVIGYWQTYDIKCGSQQVKWEWKKVPPQFVCMPY
jgi:hypothetical protein